MSEIIKVTNVSMSNQESKFFDEFEFNVAFESIEQVETLLIWRITYVACPDKPDKDQELDEIEMEVGGGTTYTFTITSPPPRKELIPKSELLGVTAILLSCSYDDKEFFRVGFYVNTYYKEETLNEEPPDSPEYDKLYRSILADQPRVTHFVIDWKNAYDPSISSDLNSAVFGGFGVKGNPNLVSGFAPPPEKTGFGISPSEEAKTGQEELEDTLDNVNPGKAQRPAIDANTTERMNHRKEMFSKENMLSASEMFNTSQNKS